MADTSGSNKPYVLLSFIWPYKTVAVQDVQDENRLVDGHWFNIISLRIGYKMHKNICNVHVVQNTFRSFFYKYLFRNHLYIRVYLNEVITNQ